MNAVYKAIAGVAKDLSEVGISKDSRNQQQGFQFRGIDAVYNALSPALVKNGLVILPRITDRTVTERVTKNGAVLFYVVVKAEFDFVATEDGSSHTIVTFGEAMDSGDKATNKAMSIAYKYAAFQAFCIPTEETAQDPDAEIHHPVSQPAKPQISQHDALKDFKSKAGGMSIADLEAAYKWMQGKLKGSKEMLDEATGIYQIRKTELELPA